jgi:hypothetical protein
MKIEFRAGPHKSEKALQSGTRSPEKYPMLVPKVLHADARCTPQPRAESQVRRAMHPIGRRYLR